MKTLLLLLILPMLYDAEIKNGRVIMNDDTIENCSIFKTDILSLGSDTLKSCLLEKVRVFGRCNLVIMESTILDSINSDGHVKFIECNLIID